MLMAMISRILSAWFAFFIPCYQTWKALAHRPLSEPDLERWAMYWTCIGAFVAFENVAEWFIDWVPFYWEMRTLLLLFLALPQTQGSTWVYSTYIQPYFSKNESDIDASILSAQTHTVTFVQTKFSALWETLWRLATKQGTSSSSVSGTQPGAPGAPDNRPSQAPGNLLASGANLFHTYGPWALGAVQRSFGSAQPRPENPRTDTQNSMPRQRPQPSPGVQQRIPFQASSENVSTPSSHSAVPPPFPTPQFY